MIEDENFENIFEECTQQQQQQQQQQQKQQQKQHWHNIIEQIT